MVAFIASVLVMVLLTALVIPMAKRRPVGTPLTWGEAMVASVYAFFLMFWVYGVVPHLFLTIRDIAAVLIYVVLLGAQIALWVWWQNRGKRAAAAESAQATVTSEYGRPLVRKS